jgi:hypothetical protein
VKVETTIAWRLFVSLRSPTFEIARALMGFDHIASFIVKAGHGAI